MKKMIAMLMALAMMFSFSAACLAEAGEAAAAPELMNGLQFNMDMDQVMSILNLPDPEIEKEHNHGGTEFWELEYEHVTVGESFSADVKFLFVGNSLVAIHYDMSDRTKYDDVLAYLTGKFGAAVPFDAAKVGNGRYAIDDDGEVSDCKDMIDTPALIIVLERDHDGEVDVTFLDPTAAYLNV